PKKAYRSKLSMSNKENILEAATILFASKGFDGTSVRDIAQKVGLSVPGMFHYYSSKEEILYEIMTLFMDTAYQKIMEIYGVDIDPTDKLSEICKFYVEQYAGHKHQLTILASERRSLAPEHQRICIAKERDYVKALTNLFKELTKRRRLKAIDHSILAFIFFGMVHWTYQWYNPKAKGGIGPNELGRIMSEVFLRGILRKSGG
ncbi:MAG TPA: TetR/AcrR family transcriptional regulator, partial [Thermodesulfobacteriota bacterium]|nr:TetR/AcrR family transcriptional regulator [Thermodesulfobacteriota bacterium]